MTRGIGWKKKSTNTSSSFDSIVYILSHVTKMRLFWSLLKANDVLLCVSIFNYLKWWLLLFWNNMGHSIHMLGWFILWKVAQCKYVTWHFKIKLIQNINIWLVGT